MTAFIPTLSRLTTAAALVAGLAASASAAPAAQPDAATAARAALKAAPAPGTSGSGLIANHGQWPSEALFMAPIQGGHAWVTAKGIVYDFTKATKHKRADAAAMPPDLRDGAKLRPERVQGHVVRLDFAGAVQPAVRPTGKLKTRLNYLSGNHASRQASNVAAYTAVSLDGVWPGVDLRLAQGPGGLELSFNAANAAALAKARVFVSGASLVEGRGEGAVVSTSLGQRSLGAVAVSLGSARHAGKLTGGTVALAPGRPLATPAVPAGTAGESSGGLVYSTFIGDYGSDQSRALVVDASGAAYVTGNTASPNFPTTLGAYDTTYNGGPDVFVTKLAADGSSLVYSTFLGGGGGTFESGEALAVDASGAAYVTGYTQSADFPTTPGAYDRTINGDADAFIIKLSADGSALAYSTFLGGESWDDSNGLAVDVDGTIYVAGQTQSGAFPTTPGAYDTTYNAGYGDAFVAKLTADGSALVYSTFLGGSDAENSYGSNTLAVDTSGAAYVTGFTASKDFPTTPGALDTSHNGKEDAYVTKISADGSALVYSTFLGGRYNDTSAAVTVDASGMAYVTGVTNSSDFPATPGAFDATYAGGYGDAFVIKLSADGSALVYATFLGDSARDSGLDLAVDADGAAYVAGHTDSPGFPTTSDAFDTTHNDGTSSTYQNGDAFVAKLSADGSTLAYSTFLGGKKFDSGGSLAVNTSGAAYVLGHTNSSNFPVTSGAFDTTFSDNGGTPPATDVFVTKLDLGGPADDIDLSATVNKTSVAAGGSFKIKYTVSNHTDDPITGDLFLLTKQKGNLLAQEEIVADMTIAAHGLRTGSFTETVAAGTEPGVYTYSLRFGQFPDETEDKVVFKITVTAAPRTTEEAASGRR